MRRLAAWVVSVAAATVVGSGVLAGHAVVFPRTSTPGAYEKYVLRVPNERPIPTREVRLAFPPDIRVVSFGDVAGWTLTVQRDSANQITGAVWTGEIGVERFVEFPFVAVNPRSGGRLTWPAVQIYANGERVDWAGPEDSDTPASFTIIEAPQSGRNSALVLALAAGALVLSLVAVTLALRRRA
jgi:uncharacterized protein YcnI